MAESFIPSIYPNSSVVQGAVAGAQNPYNIVSGATSGAQQATVPGLASAVQSATLAGGQIDYPRLQRMLGLTNEQMNSMIGSGQLSSYTSPTSAGGLLGGAQTGISSPFPIAGQIDQNRNNAIMNAPIDRSVSGGGVSTTSTGGNTAQTGGSFNSAALGNALSGMPTSPSFGSQTPISTAGVNYQPPTGQSISGPQSGVLNMQPASAQNAMNQYLGSAGNQLLGDPSYARYQQSPGYQYAVDTALGQVQRNASSRGLLESGRVMRDMTDRAQGMALQDYGNWWNRQNQLFGDYQNRLAGLAGGDTGAQNAMQLGTNLGTGTYQTGSNIASLFGNQGSSGLGAFTNTGAAQANTMQNAANTQLQVNSANTSSALAGAMSRGLF